MVEAAVLVREVVGGSIVSNYLARLPVHEDDSVLIASAASELFCGSFEPWSAGRIGGCTVSHDVPSWVTPCSIAADSRYIVGLLIEGEGTHNRAPRSSLLAPGTLIAYGSRAPFAMEFRTPYRYNMFHIAASDLGAGAHSLETAAEQIQLPSGFGEYFSVGRRF
ncbi:hypothetical protein ACQP1G_30295 [Nocardia sp. CA-107356]|uniref:hypothetical protein n=1 Tax=Nocardia sp. CA-107356 TaxID=3239972 RepID=UPI003D93B3D1